MCLCTIQSGLRCWWAVERNSRSTFEEGMMWNCKTDFKHAFFNSDWKFILLSEFTLLHSFSLHPEYLPVIKRSLPAILQYIIRKTFHEQFQGMATRVEDLEKNVHPTLSGPAWSKCTCTPSGFRRYCAVHLHTHWQCGIIWQGWLNNDYFSNLPLGHNNIYWPRRFHRWSYAEFMFILLVDIKRNSRWLW